MFSGVNFGRVWVYVEARVRYFCCPRRANGAAFADPIRPVSHGRDAMRLVTSSLFAAGFFAWAALAAADEFRIETKIFSGDEVEPVSENTTLFTGNVVYDFLANPPEVAVFKLPLEETPGRFILLDTEGERRAELTTDQIQKFMLRLRAMAAGAKDPWVAFSASPQFDVQFDNRRGEMTLASETMSYRLLTLEARTTTIADQYRDFSDWYARLAVILRPGSALPAPRLMVNRELNERGLLPREVHLTIPARNAFTGDDVTLRSEHRVMWRISKDDRQRIDAANRQLIKFKLVEFEEFRRGQ